MFWQIEEIFKEETKIINQKTLIQDFKQWDIYNSNLFAERYIEGIKHIFSKIGGMLIYWDNTKEFIIYRNPKNHGVFAFLYGNLVLIRDTFQYSDFFFLGESGYERPYGYKTYLFGFDTYLSTSNDLYHYFFKNKIKLNSLQKTKDFIKYDLTDEITSKTMNWVFDFNDFDFIDEDNVSRIVKFKF
jgi:hypothetical protein